MGGSGGLCRRRCCRRWSRCGGFGLLLGSLFLRLGRGEADLMDSVRRADGDALTAEAALSVVDVGEVVGYGDGLELTLLEAERTADTGIAAGLLGDPTFILVDAADEDATALGALLTQLDDVLRASLDAGTAGYAMYMDPETRLPVILEDKCVACGACVKACPKLHEWTQSARPRQPQLQSVSPL